MVENVSNKIFGGVSGESKVKTDRYHIRVVLMYLLDFKSSTVNRRVLRGFQWLKSVSRMLPNLQEIQHQRGTGET